MVDRVVSMLSDGIYKKLTPHFYCCPSFANGQGPVTRYLVILNARLSGHCSKKLATDGIFATDGVFETWLFADTILTFLGIIS